MKQYLSITHVTSNEHGEEELTLESPLPMWKAVMSALTNRAVEKTVVEMYVLVDGLWADKTTGEIMPQHKQSELMRAKNWVQRQARMNYFLGNS